MAVQKPKVFLCYARKDQDRVEALYQKLSDAGFAPWMDSKDILPGEDWKQVLIKAIREAPFFLACLSNNSVNKRGVIQEEIREALDVWRQKLDSDIYFIPVRLEECQVPEALAKFQWVDLFSDNVFKWFLQGFRAGMERLGVIRPVRLRSRPINKLSKKAVKKMLQENDFFDVYKHWMGKGIQHQYEALEQQGKKLVIDHITGLTWQQSDFRKGKSSITGHGYIQKLNDVEYAGYSNWRLPTLEEILSLMELVKNKEGFYIDPKFNNIQSAIWTADKKSASTVWVVYFADGFCSSLRVYDDAFCVRAVRESSEFLVTELTMNSSLKSCPKTSPFPPFKIPPKL